jgi:phosphopantothenoylcysteine decarboxylase/phosphopantothenate--cysteine ligase
MNDAMWAKPAVRENVARLYSQGVAVVGPEGGRLASGHVGAGRLVANSVLVEALDQALARRSDLKERRVVVSAGGTREPIDPVRFIGNRSSGKMGAALAEAAAVRGARVTLVTTGIRAQAPGIELREVETSQQMLEALRESTPGADLLLMAAAVADFRPRLAAGEKIHREGRTSLTLELEGGPDLLWELRDQPGTESMVRLGFAAEDRDLEEHAAAKLARKGLDAIFVNDILRSDIAFGADQNAGTLLLAGGRRVVLDRMPKLELAHHLIDEMVPLLAPLPSSPAG